MLHRPLYFSLLLPAFLAMAPHTHARISSDANVTTTVVDPAVITAASDLDFGPISGDANAGGKARVVAPRKPAGTSAGKASPATVIVGGAADQSYSIGLPKEAYLLKHENGRDTVTVDGFTTGMPEGLLLSGEQIIRMGATLSLDAQQAPGLYSSQAGIPVTVHYN